MKENMNSANKKPSFFRKHFSKNIEGIEGIYGKLKNKTFVIYPTTLILATYIMLLITKLIDIALLNRENIYFSVVILQMMIFILPGAIWCMFSGEKYISKLRFRIIRPDSIVIILAAAFLIASGNLLISLLFDGLQGSTDNFSLYDTFISSDDGTIPNKIYLVMAYAVLPAICEEFVFRGILCHEYERGGVLRAVLVSALFFALLHFNLQNFPIYFFSGIILAMTLYSTRSLFGSILAHFLYNIFGIFGQPYMSNLYRITSSPKLFVIIIVAVFLVSATVFCGESARLYKKYLYKGYPADYRFPMLKEPAEIRNSYIDVIKHPSAIACFLVYIIAVILSWI